MTGISVALDPTSSADPVDPPVPVEATTDPYRLIGEILEATCCYLGADAAYAGEFTGDRQVFHWIAGDAASFGLRPGASIPIVETLCHGVVAGSIPSVVNDTRADPIAGALDLTTRAGIRAYVGIPIVLPDGSIFGTLCAINHQPTPSRDTRQENFARTMSRLLADQIARIRSDASHRAHRVQRIQTAIRATEAMRIVLQPIVSLRTRVVVGEEALTRFPDERPPMAWLNDAWSSGYGMALEFASMRAALEMLPALPRDVYLSLNTSAVTVMSPELDDVLGAVDLGRIVLEITEHDPISDYDALKRRLEPFRRRGMRLAVDDACAGFASLSHVLQLAPDIVKLDVSLTRDIEQDNARQALASSLVAFGTRVGATIIAEGIENERQVEVLSVLGIGFGQGYLLGGPGNGLGRHLPMTDMREPWLTRAGDPRNNQHAR